MRTDPPVVDLLDRRGRLERFAIALVVAFAAALVAGWGVYALAEQELDVAMYTGAWRFVFYAAGLVGALAFTTTAAILRWRARRRDRAGQVPQARVVGPGR
jgi:MFS family permease